MGTITGVGDLDPTRWPNSHWRSVKVNHLNSVIFTRFKFCYGHFKLGSFLAHLPLSNSPFQ